MRIVQLEPWEASTSIFLTNLWDVDFSFCSQALAVQHANKIFETFEAATDKWAAPIFTLSCSLPQYNQPVLMSNPTTSICRVACQIHLWVASPLSCLDRISDSPAGLAFPKSYPVKHGVRSVEGGGRSVEPPPRFVTNLLPWLRAHTSLANLMREKPNIQIFSEEWKDTKILHLYRVFQRYLLQITSNLPHDPPRCTFF